MLPLEAARDSEAQSGRSRVDRWMDYYCQGGRKWEKSWSPKLERRIKWWVGGGGASMQWNLRRAHACTLQEERMRSETDRRSCMSWLASCSFIGMQISCIQKHLGVFRSLVPSLLCITSPSTYSFSSTNPPPFFFPFQKQFFASFHPFFFLLSPPLFLPLKPSQPPYIFCLHLSFLIPMPTLLPLVFFWASLTALCLISAYCSLFGRMPFLFPCIWFIQKTKRRFVKSLGVVLLSGGGFKLQAVYLDILIGVNKFFFPPSPRTL